MAYNYDSLVRSRSLIEEALDLVSRRSGYGTRTDAHSQILKGINHRGLGNPVLTNRDDQGIMFITRPNLNLSFDNIAMNRPLTTLLTSRSDTYQAYIRCVLDHVGVNDSARQLMATFFDDRLPFISLLTNTLLTCSGWPSITAPTFTSSPGVYKETWSMIDGAAKITESFSLDMTFRNIQGDPHTMLFYAWILAGCSMYLGEMVAYPDDVVERRLAYSSRVYQFKLDPTRRFILRWAATGINAIPRSLPIGETFNTDMTQPFNQGSESISISFLCDGADYNDPIVLYEFNKLQVMFNPAMAALWGVGQDITEIGGLTRILPSELHEFGYRGYPWIDYYGQNELQWWMDTEEYNQMKNEALRTNIFTDEE